MRKYLYLLLTSFFIVLSGCYEINEEIVLNENGSGRYSTRVDMSALIEMMQSFAGEEELTKGGLDRAIDTVILLKSVLDSAKNITPEDRKILEKGKMHLVMNIKENVFKADLDYPFDNYQALQTLLSGQGGGLSNVFKSVFSPPADTTPKLDAAVDPQMDDLNNVFDVTVKNGLISKKLNPEKMKKLMEKPEMAQLDQITSSGMEILYTSSIRLPRPVKKSDNELLKISDDKRTVTIKYNLLEIFTAPEKFNYTIEF